MTPDELYRFDVSGFLVVPGVLDPAQLRRLNARADAWKEAALRRLSDRGERIDRLERRIVDTIPSLRGDAEGPEAWFTRGDTRINDLVNHDDALLELVDHPRLLPYVRELVDHPRLKSTWITFRWREGRTPGHGNHAPTATHNHSHFNGRIRNNLLNAIVALEDIAIGGGGLQVIPGSHKANYPIPPGMDVGDLLVEVAMPAGSVLLFTHDIHHAAWNRSGAERRTLMLTYCPGAIANSFRGDDLYDRLFAAADEGTWRKYLLRRPKGNGDSYPMPSEAAAAAAAR